MEESEAELPGPLPEPGLFLGEAVDGGASAEVIAGPVDDRDIPGDPGVVEVARGEDAPVGKKRPVGSGRGLRQPVNRRTRLMGLGGKGVGLRRAVLFVAGRLGDRVDLARTELDGEREGERLGAGRIRPLRRRGLPGLGARLHAYRVGRPGEDEQIPEIGGIEHKRRAEADQARAPGLPREERGDLSAGDLRGDGPGMVEDLKGSRRPQGGRQFLQNRRPHRRFEREPGHPGASGIQHRLAQRCGRERVAGPVVLPDGGPQLVVRRGSPNGLDVLVLVQMGDPLRADLPAQPPALFDHADVAAETRRPQGGGGPAQAASRDEHVAHHLDDLGPLCLGVGHLSIGRMRRHPAAWARRRCRFN